MAKSLRAAGLPGSPPGNTHGTSLPRTCSRFPQASLVLFCLNPRAVKALLQSRLDALGICFASVSPFLPQQASEGFDPEQCGAATTAWGQPWQPRLISSSAGVGCSAGYKATGRWKLGESVDSWNL